MVKTTNQTMLGNFILMALGLRTQRRVYDPLRGFGCLAVLIFAAFYQKKINKKIENP